jgi:hypothetical protein
MLKALDFIPSTEKKKKFFFFFIKCMKAQNGIWSLGFLDNEYLSETMFKSNTRGWRTVCLASMRPWVQSSAPKNNNNNKKKTLALILSIHRWDGEDKRL